MTREDIIEYYIKSRNAYKDGWGLDKNMQLNLGFWYPDTKTLSEALKNLNAKIATEAEALPGHLLLDAGCGVGGTSIYMARNHGCKTYGINLVPHQVANARKNAENAGLAEQTNFQIMDYCHTTFPDNHFDIVLGIESICHAPSKREFLTEAYRILKPGGRLVLAENLQAKEDLTPKEHDQLYTFGFHGCKITSLDTEEEYMKNLGEVGFREYECKDMTSYVMPSVRRLRRLYYPAWLYNQYRALIGKPFGETELANTKMCYYLYTGLKNKLWSYGLIRAVK